MKVCFALILTTFTLTAVAMAQAPMPIEGVANVDHCLVTLEPISGDAHVPAQEAGVLTAIKVREGQSVKAGDLLIQIDDMQAQQQLKNAIAEWKAADMKAKDDIEARYAKKAAEVAEFTYLKQKQSADKVPGAVTEVDLQKYKLDWQKDVLQIEKAQKDQMLDAYTADGKKAEADLAAEGVHRRQIIAPIDGIVQQIGRSLGDWVKPGDDVLRIMRLDRLSVEGELKYSEYVPTEVANQPVTVEVQLARGRKVQVPGKVVFVDPEVVAGNYKVRAEVENRKENGEWVLRPGARHHDHRTSQTSPTRSEQIKGSGFCCEERGVRSQNKTASPLTSSPLHPFTRSPLHPLNLNPEPRTLPQTPPPRAHPCR